MAFVAALGAGLDTVDLPRVRSADFGRATALQGEWDVAVVGPHFSAALVAKDRGDQGPDSERRFDYAITHDRALVLATARSLLRTVLDATSTA